MQRILSPFSAWLVNTLAVPALCLGMLSSPAVWAAETAAQPAAAQGTPQVMRYTTRNGDTLERIAQQQFRDSPLQTAVVVKMLQEHNLLLVGEVRPRQRLKTGLLLEMPSHEQLARKVLMPYLQADQAANAEPSTPEQRKAWVRYP